MANISAFPVYCPVDYNDNRQTGNPQTQIPGTAFQEDVLGTSYTDNDPSTGEVSRKFVLMDNSAVDGPVVGGDGNVAVGSLLYYVDTDCLTVTNNLANTKASRNLVAGALLYEITPGNKGWVVTYGTMPILADNSTFVAGDQVMASGTTGTVANVAAGSAPTYPAVGVALGASTGSPLMVNVAVKIEKA